MTFFFSQTLVKSFGNCLESLFSISITFVTDFLKWCKKYQHLKPILFSLHIDTEQNTRKMVCFAGLFFLATCFSLSSRASAGRHSLNICTVNISNGLYGCPTIEIENNGQKETQGDNYLTCLRNGSLKTFADCTILDISSQNLSSIEFGVFNSLSKLTSLEISNNKIKYINTSMFAALTECTNLILKNNQLKTIQPGTFKGLIKLSILDLSFNQIAFLHVGCFDGIPNLYQLSLQHNQISTNAEHSPFKSLGALNSLNLESNNISAFSNTFLKGLCNVQVIVLGNNSLSKIQSDYFQDSKKLRYLIMRDNRIESIEAGAFVQHIDLTYLDLNNNNIQILDREMFPPHSVLEGMKNNGRLTKVLLHLKNNPILCEAIANCWITQTNNHFRVYSNCHQEENDCESEGRLQ